MHVVSRKKNLDLARTHKAHFWTHKYGVLQPKKIKILLKILFSSRVPYVCMLNIKFCDKTKVK